MGLGAATSELKLYDGKHNSVSLCVMTLFDGHVPPMEPLLPLKTVLIPRPWLARFPGPHLPEG